MQQSSSAKKRGWIRNLARRTNSSSPSGPPDRPQPIHQPQTSRSAQAGQRFLDAALQGLTTEQQAAIREHLAPGTDHVVTAVHQAYSAALSKKEDCEKKRWRCSFRGREIILRDEAGKVLSLLDRFKRVGDVVANIDPVHIGLPWAMIRTILEMTVSEAKQMTILLLGMSTTLWMSNRLDVYLEHLQRLPPSLATTNFERHLIRMYSHVLKFFSEAIRAYRTNTVERMVKAVWDPSSLIDFEIESNALAAQTDIEAGICERELAAQDREDAKQWKSTLDKTLSELDSIRKIEKSLDRLQVKVDLSKLRTATHAAFNSYDEVELSYCLPGTCTHLLSRIADWADNPSGKAMFWLCGIAGTGKSTIARTVADILEKQHRLGASFFFRRGGGDRGNAGLFFPTIARQLADKIDGLGEIIAKAFEEDSLLCERNLQIQCERLISQPLTELTKREIFFESLVIVIDALDECASQNNIRMLLRLLTRVDSVASLRIRIFVTSRPELPIQLEIGKMDSSLYEDAVLEVVQAATIEQDIEAYLEDQFSNIRSESLQKRPLNPLPADWPSKTDMQSLVSMAVPLFIFAATASRFVAQSNPRKRLDTLLQQQGGLNSGLSKIYLPVLEQAVGSRDLAERGETLELLKDVVGTIVLLADPLSLAALSDLLEIDREDFEDLLFELRSVLNVPTDSSPVRVLHLSFRDFLIDSKRKDQDELWIDESHTHKQLAERCLRRMNGSATLRSDICDVHKPGYMRAEISMQIVHANIPSDVAYACCYWPFHILESKQTLIDDGPVHQFLLRHFLHWLEALAWLGRLSDAIAHIAALSSRTEVKRGSQLLAFLDDARRFVLRNRQVIDLAPLQLYYSSLIFAPSGSIIRNAFECDGHQVFSQLTEMPSHWDAEVLTLEGHAGSVSAVAFAPDGKLIVSGARDMTTRVWSASTGEQLLTLYGPKRGVIAASFSADGKTVGSVFADSTVSVWSSSTGELSQHFSLDVDHVHRVAFAQGLHHLVLVPDKRSAQVWDLVARQKLREWHFTDKICIESVAISSDSTLVAMGLSDGRIQVCDARSGNLVREIEVDRMSSICFALSSNGEILVFGSSDRIRAWAIKTGEMKTDLSITDEPQIAAFFSDGQTIATKHIRGLKLHNLKTGDTRSTTAAKTQANDLVFSPDGLTVAIALADQTVRLWSTRACQDGDTSEVNLTPVALMAHSPDGNLVATAPSSGTIELWDPQTSRVLLTLGSPVENVAALAFSQDSRTLTSASKNGTVQLWDALTGSRLGAWSLGGEEHTGGAVLARYGELAAVAFPDQGASIGKVCNVRTGELAEWNIADGTFHWILALSPNGNSLLTTAGTSLILRDTWTGEIIRELEADSSFRPMYAATISPRGDLIAAIQGESLWIRSLMSSDRTNSTTVPADGIYDLSFSDDEAVLHTNVGDLDVPSYLRSIDKPPCQLRLVDQWVQVRGQNVVWLPQEFRQNRCEAFSSPSKKSDILVISSTSGIVAFFSIPHEP